MTQHTVNLTSKQHARLTAYARQTGLSITDALEALIPTVKPTTKTKDKVHPLSRKLESAAVDKEPVSLGVKKKMAEGRAAVKLRDGVNLEQARKELGL